MSETVRNRLPQEKAKITLSLDKSLVERIRSELSSGETLSGAVEISLANMSSEIFLERVGSALELKKEVLSPREILAMRKRGLRAEEVVREIRDEA
jgi:transcriptional regulator